MGRNNLLRFDARQKSGFPRVDARQRVYAIGDIHGRFDLFMDLMGIICEDAHSKKDERQTCFVFMGDYIDRGENSAEVLQTLTSLARMGSKHIVFLRGNHEAALQQFLISPKDAAEWLDFGGLQTLLSFGIQPPRFSAGQSDLIRVRDDLAMALSAYQLLFDTMVDVHRSGDVVFAHAGVDPNARLEEQSSDTLLWGHRDGLIDQPIPGIGIVHGHYDDASPVRLRGRICVDTGAYYTNKLTAVRLDDRDAFLSTKENVTL